MSALQQFEYQESSAPPELYIEPLNTPDMLTITEYKTHVAGSRVDFMHFKPRYVSDQTPLIIVPGYCATVGAYEEFANQLALHGREVAYAKSPRGQHLWNALQPEHMRDVLRLQSQATWYVLKHIVDTESGGKADLIAHSMGMVVAAKLATAKSGHIRSISSAGGAGLDGPHGVTSMLRKGAGVMLHEISPHAIESPHRVVPMVAIDTVKHVLRDPIRTLREGYAVARVDIANDLAFAKDHGIKIGAFLFEHDGFFTPNAVLSHSEQYFDSYNIVPYAQHIYPQTNPYEHALQQIDSLQRLNIAVSRVA